MCLDHDVSRLAKPGRKDLQNVPKVVVQQNSEHPIAFYDSGQYLVLNSTTYLANASEDLLKAICVLLNSNLISWFFKTVMTNNAGLTVNLLPNNLGLIPIPADLDLPLFSKLSDFLTHLRAVSESSPAESDKFQLWHEILVESLVVGAYFPHAIKDDPLYDRIQEAVASHISGSDEINVGANDVVVYAKNALKRLGFLQS
jgi:hypothetical protein